MVDLLKGIQNIMGSNLVPIIENSQFGEVEISQLDNSKAKNLMSWYPEVDLISGLEKSLT